MAIGTTTAIIAGSAISAGATLAASAGSKPGGPPKVNKRAQARRLASQRNAGSVAEAIRQQGGGVSLLRAREENRKGQA